MSETDFWQKSGQFGRKTNILTDKIYDKIYLSIVLRSSQLMKSPFYRFLYLPEYIQTNKKR